MFAGRIAGALPPPHHYTERSKPKLGGFEAFIERVFDEDRRAPRKQRHTARRIHRRILTEFPDAAVAESTVRNHVRERKRQMGLDRRETFVPQSYRWAHEAQVDWYEAWVDVGDERTKVQVFAMRSMASGAAFHRAYLHATQQALSASTLQDVMGVPAWKSHPCWFLVAGDDQAIPPDAERQFAKRMDATTVEVASGHLAMISHPDEVARLIETAAKAVQAEIKWSGR